MHNIITASQILCKNFQRVDHFPRQIGILTSWILHQTLIATIYQLIVNCWTSHGRTRNFDDNVSISLCWSSSGQTDRNVVIKVPSPAVWSPTIDNHYVHRGDMSLNQYVIYQLILHSQLLVVGSLPRGHRSPFCRRNPPFCLDLWTNNQPWRHNDVYVVYGGIRFKK